MKPGRLIFEPIGVRVQGFIGRGGLPQLDEEVSRLVEKHGRRSRRTRTKEVLFWRWQQGDGGCVYSRSSSAQLPIAGWSVQMITGVGLSQKFEPMVVIPNLALEIRGREPDWRRLRVSVYHDGGRHGRKELEIRGQGHD